MTIFKLPDLGEGLPDAEIHQWYVNEGDEVTIDQPLVSMETAKAVVDVPSPFNGRIQTLHGKPGDIINTGSALITFVTEGTAKDSSQPDTGTVVGVIESSDKVLEESPTGVALQTSGKAVIKAAPAVRALAKQLHVDLSTVTGTGPGGTILAADVQQIADQTAAHSQGEPLHGSKRIMAQLMAKSHAEVVPATLTEDADLHLWPEKTDITLRLIRAITAACQAEPALNAHFFAQGTRIKLSQEINLGIAIDTPHGLYVPVLKDIARQSPQTLRENLNHFKTKANSQSFTPEDLHDATISLSNFGTIAGRYSSPVVVPPAVAIVAVGKTRLSVVAVDGEVVIHPLMPVSLTFDHRAVTGGEAARFLAAFIKDIQLG